MFFLRRPSDAAIARVLEAQRELPFSYAEVGVTRGDHEPTLRRNHHRVRLGTGEAAYEAAVAAMRRWVMYALPWTEVHPPEAPVQPGTVLATVVRHLGFWSVNPCRVVYHDVASAGDRAESFAIGTLPGHSERGEERFRVEWHRADGAVWFEILAYAEPRHWLARLGTPIVYRLQRRFGEEALRAMRSAVEASG